MLWTCWNVNNGLSPWKYPTILSRFIITNELRGELVFANFAKVWAL